MQLQAITAFLGLSLVGSAASKAAGHFDITPEEGKAYRCGAECQHNINTGNIHDRQSTGDDFDFQFYQRLRTLVPLWPLERF